MFEIREKKCPIVPNCINRTRYRIQQWSFNLNGTMGHLFSLISNILKNKNGNRKSKIWKYINGGNVWNKGKEMSHGPKLHK